jgi:uncharacterized metal-binding protein
MKTFNESIFASRPLQVVMEKTVNVDWSKGTESVKREVLKAIQSDVEDAMKNEIEQKIKQFYIDNPRKFKYSYSISSEYSIYMKPFKESKKYQELESLYKSIGMSGAFDSRESVYFCNISADTANKKDVDNIKFVDTRREDVISDDVRYGNGYNSLPAKIINEYRGELLKLFSKKAEVRVTKFEKKHKASHEANVDYYVVIRPVIDESKIKKLEDMILGNEELMIYRDSLRAASRDISNYYDSKRSGDYTGD